MAYDPVKAHEYYVNYRKKGLKKGRKKATAKSTSSTKKTTTKKSKESIVGISTVGLNDEGKMEFALIKQDLKKQMNDALDKAKTDEDKARIRREFHNKALEAVQNLKADTKYAKAKTKKEKSSTSRLQDTETRKLQRSIDELNLAVKNLSSKLALMDETQKAQAKTLVSDIIKELESKLKQKNKG